MGGNLPAISYPQTQSGSASVWPNPRRTTFVQRPEATTLGADETEQLPRTSGKRATERLETLTIRELIIELGKAEEAMLDANAGQFWTGMTTRREWAIIEELHRRRDEPVAGSDGGLD